MSAAELSSAATRHPWDWYVEQPWVTEKLIEALGPDQFGEMVWDPACGRGNLLSCFEEYWTFSRIEKKADGPRQYLDKVLGSDICFRGYERQWRDHNDIAHWNFLSDDGRQARGFPLYRYENHHLSIVSNPPYSQQAGKLVRGLAEEFCRKALTIATHKVCMLLPLKWMAGEARQRFLAEYPPRFYLILNERPSMPPGNMIEQLGDKAFKRGKVDYMWVVWDKQVVTLPGETRTIHITPRPKEERV